MKNAHNRSTAPTKAGRRRENWGPAKVPPTLARHRMADQGHLPPADFRDRDGALWHGTSRRPRARVRRLAAFRRVRLRAALSAAMREVTR